MQKKASENNKTMIIPRLASDAGLRCLPISASEVKEW
jgi:hypothetical protein